MYIADDRNTPIPVSPSSRRARWLRCIGFAVLLLGIVGGEELYRVGLLAPDRADNPEMIGCDRAARRQMAMLYGTQGKMIMEFEDAIRLPRNQAIMILVGSVLVAGGCWYFARFVDRDAKIR